MPRSARFRGIDKSSTIYNTGCLQYGSLGTTVPTFVNSVSRMLFWVFLILPSSWASEMGYSDNSYVITSDRSTLQISDTSASFVRNSWTDVFSGFLVSLSLIIFVCLLGAIVFILSLHRVLKKLTLYVLSRSSTNVFCRDLPIVTLCKRDVSVSLPATSPEDKLTRGTLAPIELNLNGCAIVFCMVFVIFWTTPSSFVILFFDSSLLLVFSWDTIPLISSRFSEISAKMWAVKNHLSETSCIWVIPIISPSPGFLL